MVRDSFLKKSVRSQLRNHLAIGPKGLLRRFEGVNM